MVACNFILPTKFGLHVFFETYRKLIIQGVRQFKKWDRKQLLQSYYKVWQRLITKCVRYYKVCQVLQSVTDCYYKVRQVLQSATVITKWDVTPFLIKWIFWKRMSLLVELIAHVHIIPYKSMYPKCHFIFMINWKTKFKILYLLSFLIQIMEMEIQ